MLVSSTNEFQAFMFEQLHFLPEMNGNYTCYSDRKHPEGGYCCIYSVSYTHLTLPTIA